ncbi:MAG: regulatory protein RecX [Brumimicrobium sp.]|nr:regulatory protein RecX [Brumimicrobium sp.]
MKGDEKEYTFLEAKQKIEAWCAYRDRCHSEVSQKLREMGLDGEDTNALISHLIEYRFVDEQRFADSFVSGKYRIKRWGKHKILAHLRQKHVPEPCINAALKQIDDDEYMSNLYNLASKKWKEKRGTSFEKKAKVQQFLSSKGYEFDLILDVIKSVESEGND